MAGRTHLCGGFREKASAPNAGNSAGRLDPSGRLSDGHDKALRLPAAAPYLDAHLEPAGLFVSWNKMYDRRPGRLAFVPLRAIAGRS